MTTNEYLDDTKETNRGACCRRASCANRRRRFSRTRQYGVRECWLVDLYREQVTLVDFTGSLPVERIARGAESIRSAVLPDLELPASGIFS